MTSHAAEQSGPVGPRAYRDVPKYSGLITFSRLPRLDEVAHADVAVLGVPFDGGTSYRPGARFGPEAIRSASRMLRPYNQDADVHPYGTQQVVDAGDVPANPWDIETAVAQIETGVAGLVRAGTTPMILGGDHTLALPALRAVAAVHGPVAVLHFDAHLDTWDTSFGAAVNHGTPFRRASEEGLLDLTGCMHVGIRGPLGAASDLVDDRELGFQTVHCAEIETIGVAGVAERVRRRVGDRPLYVSVDIDVLDPAFAPGTGTPESGGMTSRELLAVLRTLAGRRLVGADVVEVAPAYDHADITAIAASHTAYELLSAMAASRAAR